MELCNSPAEDMGKDGQRITVSEDENRRVQRRKERDRYITGTNVAENYTTEANYNDLARFFSVIFSLFFSSAFPQAVGLYDTQYVFFFVSFLFFASLLLLSSSFSAVVLKRS